MKNRKETEVVLEVVAKCLERIKEINEMRKVRKPLQVVSIFFFFAPWRLVEHDFVPLSLLFFDFSVLIL